MVSRDVDDLESLWIKSSDAGARSRPTYPPAVLVVGVVCSAQCGEPYCCVMPADQDNRGQCRTEGGETGEAAEGSARRGRILVVDDEPLMGSAIARLLFEHTVVATTSARVAADRIVGGEAFDVILCDVVLPDFSGIDLYDTIARQRPDILRRVIFVTGGAYTAEAIAFLDRIGNLQLEKPLRPNELRDAVALILKTMAG